MRKGLVLPMVLILFLSGMLSVTLEFDVVRASATVYIRADGNIEPMIAPIERHGNVYTVMRDINDRSMRETCTNYMC